LPNRARPWPAPTLVPPYAEEAEHDAATPLERDFLMSDDAQNATDADRKKAAEEHSRRLTQWLREGMNADGRDSTQPEDPSPRKAA